ncbi:MAG: RNA polymerase sigma factor [Solirubrobacteraceae bacterium]
MAPLSSDDDRGSLLVGLRAGDEMAFRTLVNRHHGAMRRVALSFVKSGSIADEVVQETWLAVIRGIDRFEQRSSLKTWIFGILVKRALSRAAREHRAIPFSALQRTVDDDSPAVDPDRFLAGDHAFRGYWCVPPTRYSELPEDRALAAETRDRVTRAIDDLPLGQRQVISLRDVEGWEAEEVCDLLGLSAANQRVLLHRARARVRSALEAYFSEPVPT